MASAAQTAVPAGNGSNQSGLCVLGSVLTIDEPTPWIVVTR